MNHVYKVLMFIVFMVWIIPTMAQEKNIIIYTNNLWIDKHPQDAPSPKFVITSNNGKFQLGIGGYAKLNGLYDFQDLDNLQDFITYELPVPQNPDRRGRLNLSANQSRLHTEFLGKTNKGIIKIYLEGDFRGDNNVLRLRQAYGQYRGFLFGQTWTTLMDLGASPNTIDFEGPNCEVSFRTAMIRYGAKISDHFKFAVALETPDPSITNTSSTKLISQYWPDVIARIKWHGKLGHLMLGSVFRDIAYEDSVTKKNKTAHGYGVSFSGSVNITKNDLFMFQAVYGKGIAYYIQDISGVGLDLVPKNPGSGALEALPAYGVYGAYQHNWTTKSNSTLVYGFTYVEDLGFKPNNAFKLGQYFAANLFYDYNDNISTAIEYLWGQRTNKDDAKGPGSRVNFMVQYSF